MASPPQAPTFPTPDNRRTFEMLLQAGLVILGAVLGAFLSIMFVMVWDVYKDSKDTKQQDDQLFYALALEANANRLLLDANLERIQFGRIAQHQQGKTNLAPLLLLNVGSLDALKYRVPKALLSNPDDRNMVHAIALALEAHNQLLIARNEFLTLHFAYLGSGNEIQRRDVLTGFDNDIEKQVTTDDENPPLYYLICELQNITHKYLSQPVQQDPCT